jgi:hypothetical protein
MVPALVGGVTSALQNLDSSFTAATATPVTPDAATIAWWQSGQAASGATYIDTIPTTPLAVVDNPTSPGTVGAQGENPLPSGSTLANVGKALATIAVVGVAAVLLVEIAPPIARAVGGR